MSKYIDADAIIKRLKSRFCDKCYNYNGKWCRACLIADIICAIDDEPTADVEEVKRGRWIIDRKFGNDVMSDEQMVICSVCGKGIFYGKQNYCPNCGSRMDLDEVTE